MKLTRCYLRVGRYWLVWYDRWLGAWGLALDDGERLISLIGFDR